MSLLCYYLFKRNIQTRKVTFKDIECNIYRNRMNYRAIFEFQMVNWRNTYRERKDAKSKNVIAVD